MTTALERPLRREVTIEDRPYTVVIDSEGVRLTEKGRRKGVQLRWRDLVNGDAAIASALNVAASETATVR